MSLPSASTPWRARASLFVKELGPPFVEQAASVRGIEAAKTKAREKDRERMMFSFETERSLARPVSSGARRRRFLGARVGLPREKRDGPPGRDRRKDVQKQHVFVLVGCADGAHRD